MASSRVLVAVVLAMCVAGYFLYKPLPDKIADRPRLQIFETFVRLFYLYPMMGMTLLGARWQIYWARLAMHSLVAILNPWTRYDPHLMITDSMFNDIPVRIYEPLNRSSDGALIYVHGGGFVLFSIDTHDGPVREIARSSGVVTISIEYRLAPEHIFPAGLEDCLSATRYFLERGYAQFGVDPHKVAIGGDSAGGNIATVVAHKLRHTQLPKLKTQVLIYPFLQYVDLMTPSYQLYHAQYAGVALLDPHSIARWMLIYLGLDPGHTTDVLSNLHVSPEVHAKAAPLLAPEDLPPAFYHEFYQPQNRSFDQIALSENLLRLQDLLLDPDFSPLMQPDLTGLPDTYLVTCEYDILRDEGYWYASRLRKAGVQVTHKHYASGFHAMINFHSEIEVGQQALESTGMYLRQALST